MQTLLCHFDDDRRQDWLDRLTAHGAEVVVAASLEEAAEAAAAAEFAAALLAWNQDARWHLQAAELLKTLRTRAQLTLCLTGHGVQPAPPAVYALGFDDRLPEDCCEEELHAKLSHAGELELLNQRLAQAQKLESIGELAAGIAHEINTPIQYVGDNTRFLQEAYGELSEVLDCCQALADEVKCSSKPKLPQAGDAWATKAWAHLYEVLAEADLDYLREEIPSAIRQTLEGVERVANIVRAMKEFAHPGASEMVPTDLAKSIENTVMVARNEWKYVADLRTIHDPQLPLVPCLPGEFNQVLLNMIVNAAHAVGEALGDSPSTKGLITVATRHAPPFAEVRISDTGAGIPREIMDRIFTPFFTTKAAGKGTGQGLAIARVVVVEKHHGVISVDSEPGAGATFTIQLPLVQAAKKCVVAAAGEGAAGTAARDAVVAAAGG